MYIDWELKGEWERNKNKNRKQNIHVQLVLSVDGNWQISCLVPASCHIEVILCWGFVWVQKCCN